MPLTEIDPTKGVLMIDAKFAGGNIIVDKIEGDTISVHPDQRDTDGEWFYWYFRVRGASGRTLRFQFREAEFLGALGPAVSTDGGSTWSWLGADHVEDTHFWYAFDSNMQEVRFCVSIPYVESNLDAFLERHLPNPHARVDSLCETAKGRKVERIHLGKLDGSAPVKILLTARHHACEMIASYALEGIMEAVLSPDDLGRWFREHVEVAVVPFVDKDGVEDGDQGKLRIPRDHNQDYDGSSVHASTRALRDYIPAWSEGKLRFALDMHCPTLRETDSESVYFVGTSNRENWEKMLKFCHTLESNQQGPIPYRADNNMPYGTGWNVADDFIKGKWFANWAEDLTGVCAASTLEIPYAKADGVSITPERVRALGRDLATAIRRFLDSGEC